MTASDFEAELDRRSRRRLMAALLLILAVVSMTVLSPSFGQYRIPFGDVYGIIWRHIIGDPVQGNLDHVVVNIRLPTVATACIAGFALGMCGAVMQTLLRNPLADPYTMGISSGASLGVALFFVLGIGIVPGLSGDASMVSNAFILSLIPTSVVILVSRFRRMTSTAIILCGIAVMYLFSSITSLLMLIADPTSLSSVYEWNLGSVGKGSWDSIPLIFASTTTCYLLFMLASRRMDIVSSGDRLAHTVGVDPARTRTALMVASSFSVAIIVSFTGTIGFIGLVAPHVARMVTGSDSRNLITASGLIGSIILIGSDCIARSLGGLPVGVITSLVGCPLFILLLLKRRKADWSRCQLFRP